MLSVIDWLIDWLHIILRPARNILLIEIHIYCQWCTAEVIPLLGSWGLWAGRVFNSGLVLCGLIRIRKTTAPFSGFLTQARGLKTCYGPEYLGIHDKNHAMYGIQTFQENAGYRNNPNNVSISTKYWAFICI